jgi:hypothetical protein
MSHESEIDLRVSKEGKISVDESDTLSRASGDEGADMNQPAASGAHPPSPPLPAVGVGGIDALLAALDALPSARKSAI